MAEETKEQLRTPTKAQMEAMDDYDCGPEPKFLTPEAIRQIEATCGPVPKSKGGTGPG